jgi:hypothetical protein
MFKVSLLNQLKLLSDSRNKYLKKLNRIMSLENAKNVILPLRRCVPILRFFSGKNMNINGKKR